MRSSSQKDFGVFDFKEEDEAVETASGRFLSKPTKRGNPRAEEPSLSKYAFLEAFSRQMNVKQIDTNDVLCVDIDASDGDQKCNARMPSAISISEQDFATLGEASVMDRILVSSTSNNGLVHMCEDRSEDGSLLPEYFREDPHGIRASSIRASTGNKESNCTLLEILSNGKQVDESSDDDDSWTSSPSLSSPASGHAGTEGSFELPASDDCRTGFGETENIDTAVIVSADYAIYRGTLYGEPLLTFFSDCIKIECSDADGIEEAFVSEWSIVDVIHIDCQWSQSAGTALSKVCLRPIAVIGAEKVHDASDIETLIFNVSDSHWSERAQKIMSLAPRYKDIWNIEPDAEMEKEVDAFMGLSTFISRHYLTVFMEPFEDVVYPKGDPDAVTVSKRDIELLQPETFINDTIIDFYIKYLKNKIQPQENDRFHFFNSFFFRKLVDLDKDPGSVSEGRAAFLRVRKWTRKVNIFEKDYIFIPVNFNLHWSLLVICHPGEVAYFKEKEIDEALKVPCILHMDSIKGSHNGLKNLIQSYLWEEWKERHPESPEDIKSNFSNLRFASLELPQQENSFDCGLFLLHYVEMFLKEAPINFSPLKIAKFSNFLNMDWFIPAEASHKRFVIRNLLCNLLNDTSQKVYTASCSNGRISSKLPEKDIDKEPFLALSSLGSAAKTDIGNSACSDSDRGSELKLLDGSPPGSVECDTEAGLVLRQFFEHRPTSGSSPDHNNCPNQKSRCTMSLIEEDAETNEQFVYPNTDKSNYRPLTGTTTTEICTTSHSSKDAVEFETLWKPKISIRVEDPRDGDSSEPLNCRSLNSFEQKSFKMVLKDQDSSPQQDRDSGISDQKEERDKRGSVSPEYHGDVPDSPASASGHLLENCIAKDSQDVDTGVSVDSPASASGDLPENCIAKDSQEVDTAVSADSPASASGDLPENCIVKDSQEVDTVVSESKDRDTSFASSQGNNTSGLCHDVDSTENGNSLDEDDERLANIDLVLSLERQPYKRQKLMPSEGVRRRTRSFTRDRCS